MPWIDCHESRSRSLKCLRIVHPATVPPLRILEVPPPPKNCQLRILAYKNHMLPTSTFKETWIILDPTINCFSILFFGKDAPIHPFFLSHRRQRSTLHTCRLTKKSVRQMVVIPPFWPGGWRKPWIWPTFCHYFKSGNSGIPQTNVMEHTYCPTCRNHCLEIMLWIDSPGGFGSASAP